MGGQLRSGAVIADTYQVLRPIGAGGHAQIYLAEHSRTGRLVALKVLEGEPSVARATAQRFIREPLAASAARHPNVVEMLDAGQLEDGRCYTVMEYLPGTTVWAALRKAGAFPLARAAKVAAHVGKALRASHAVGIVHRDVKSENVMLISRAGEERIKLLDFGIALREDEDEPRLTTPGMAVGTAETMAPEQMLGQAATHAVDIYALGVLLFEMLAGTPPFIEGTALEIVTRKVREAAPDLSVIKPNLPPEICRLVADCLARLPEDRPKNTDEFLRRLVAVPGARLSRRELGLIPRKRPSRRHSLGAAAGLAVLLGSGAVLAGVLAQDSADHAAARGAPQVAAASPMMAPRMSQPAPTHATVLDPDNAADDGGPDCAQIRRRARGARERHAWSTLLRAAKNHRQCFSSAHGKQLRTLAYKELGQFEHCVVAGRGSSDPEIAGWVRLCERRMDEDEIPSN